MPMLDSLDAAAVVADRIIRSLGEPFDLDGRQGNVSASIGISILPAQATDASSLLHNADVAMYHAKRSGKAVYKFYATGLEAPPEVGGGR
jgi:predicted signal transduction protein with EAL and GGDEF domain